MLIFYVAAFVVLFLFPILMPGSYTLTFMILGVITLINAAGLTISNGYLGLFNAGQIAFFGLGAYVFALVTLQTGISFSYALILSGLAAAFLSLIIGFVGIRIKGAMFAVITLSTMMVLWVGTLAWVDLTRGALGLPFIPRPVVFGIAFDSSSMLNYYYLYLAIGMMSFFFLYFLISSRVGRTFVAIRENELLASSLGINVTRYKILGFVIASFFGGIAGGMQASFITYIDPSIFSFYTLVVVMAVISLGANTLEGTLLTSFTLTILPEVLRSTEMLRDTIFGIALIVLSLSPLLLKGMRVRALKIALRGKHNGSDGVQKR